MSGTNPWLWGSLLCVIVILTALSYVALGLFYRLTRAALTQVCDARHQSEIVALEIMGQVRALQKDQATIIGELIAHRTLEATGSQLVASQMLQHSNAHDLREDDQFTVGKVQEPPEPELPISPHVADDFMLGEDEPPLPDN